MHILPTCQRVWIIRSLWECPFNCPVTREKFLEAIHGYERKIFLTLSWWLGNFRFCLALDFFVWKLWDEVAKSGDFFVFLQCFWCFLAPVLGLFWRQSNRPRLNESARMELGTTKFWPKMPKSVKVGQNFCPPSLKPLSKQIAWAIERTLPYHPCMRSTDGQSCLHMHVPKYTFVSHDVS